MKITLIQGKYFNSWESLGLGYIGSYIQKNIKDVELNFYQGSFDNVETIVDGAKCSNIVAFSCTTPTFNYVANIAKKLKKMNPNIKTVIGGYHPSAVPNQCLNGFFDHVVVGEGETAMVKIIKGAKNNIIYGESIGFNQMPWPDRELIKNERNINMAFEENARRITSFHSHRGCPFNCIFCADGYSKVLYGRAKRKRIRHRDVKDLLNEMEDVVANYHIDLMKFSDPTWNTNVNWVLDFCKEKIKRGFKVPFYPNIHAGTCTEEMFHLMAEANCFEIAIGIESGSSKILKQIGKCTNIQKIKNAVSWAKKVGILVRGYFILGMPDESEEDIILTDNLAEELNLDEYGFTILCPYPGTKLYNETKYQSVDWEKADEYSNDFWESNFNNNEKLKEYQNYFREKYKVKLTKRMRIIMN
jgi:anaerobic magnesium-protoporphyrin IX monomethyl ester cyclase